MANKKKQRAKRYEKIVARTILATFGLGMYAWVAAGCAKVEGIDWLPAMVYWVACSIGVLLGMAVVGWAFAVALLED
ncbi:MAG: hypothetical protein IT285_16100 [Bdellovibrionales bacterium]|nr:hypothetical protein [Bdellovibrionales bacterium]